tara:strand:+ start:1370 stop:2731 length:1362 start_codon:yes stop_codon:yes gene_type:complete
MAKYRKPKKKLEIGEFYNLYGVMNDLAPPDNSPIASPRSLNTTNAWSQVVKAHYTPDVLKDKDTFMGVVLASIPTLVPRLTTRSQRFEVFASTFRTTRVMPILYTYKVLIPELENKCLDLDKQLEKALKKRGTKNPMTMLQRIYTMMDVGLDTTLYNTHEGIRAIQSGTLVKVVFEDLARLKGPKITAIYKKVFNWDADGVITANSNKFDVDSTKGLMGAPLEITATGEQSAKYIGNNIEHQYVKNGALPQELLTKVSHQGRTATILKEMETDLLAFAAAYDAQFPESKFLMGQSYRRLGKNTEDKWTQKHLYKCYKTKPFEEGTDERKWYNALCTSGNKAAVPGTSRHGWGAAVDLKSSAMWSGNPADCTPDLDPKWYGNLKDRHGNFKCNASLLAPEFKWLNANAATYNFVFNVGTEKWHISWIPVGSVLSGIKRPGRPWVAVDPAYAPSS